MKPTPGWLTLPEADRLVPGHRIIILEACHAGRIRTRYYDDDMESWRVFDWTEFSEWQINQETDWDHGTVFYESDTKPCLHRGDLMAALELPADVAAEPEETRGRKRTWDWEGAIAAVFGQIYRGDVYPEPKLQAEIEHLLEAWFQDQSGGRAPAESQIRERANLILREIKKVKA